MTVMCVVEEARDIMAIEKTGEFRGRYHVLLGAISPIDGVGPEQLKVRELLTRLQTEQVEEIILCTNPNIEGEATALYLARLLKPVGVKVTVRPSKACSTGALVNNSMYCTVPSALE